MRLITPASRPGLLTAGPPGLNSVTHHPSSAGAEMGFHVGGLESAFRAPPLDELFRIDQRLENPVGGSIDGDFGNDDIVGASGIHGFFSMNFLRSRRFALQKA